ncbi:hypothetical protein [Salinicoccus bachuensis]|uniref:Uncharacterized protein n=1 Tax=Salinicoccus bachuensis TaxID=3136731 RepID=A0ABZ3CH36_9STAP
MENNEEWFIDKIIHIIKMGEMMNLNLINVDSVSIRSEANVITAVCFRNTQLENIHASNSPEKLTKDFMTTLMVTSSGMLTEWLIMRENLLIKMPKLYNYILTIYENYNVKNWNKGGSKTEKTKKTVTFIGDITETKYFNRLNTTLHDYLKSNSPSFIEKVLICCKKGITYSDTDYLEDFSLDIPINQEAAVISEFCFANSIPEGWYDLEDPLNDIAMKELMIESSDRVAEWLTMKDTLLEEGLEGLYEEVIILLTETFELTERN